MTIAGIILSVLCGVALLGFLGEMGKYAFDVDAWRDLWHSKRPQ